MIEKTLVIAVIVAVIITAVVVNQCYEPTTHDDYVSYVENL